MNGVALAVGPGGGRAGAYVLLGRGEKMSPVSHTSRSQELTNAMLHVLDAAEEAAARMLALVEMVATDVTIEGTAAFGRVVGVFELVPVIEEGLLTVSRVSEAAGCGRSDAPSIQGLRSLMHEVATEMGRQNPVGVADILAEKVAPEVQALRAEIRRFRSSISSW